MGFTREGERGCGAGRGARGEGVGGWEGSEGEPAIAGDARWRHSRRPPPRMPGRAGGACGARAARRGEPAEAPRGRGRGHAREGDGGETGVGKQRNASRQPRRSLHRGAEHQPALAPGQRGGVRRLRAAGGAGGAGGAGSLSQRALAGRCPGPCPPERTDRAHTSAASCHVSSLSLSEAEEAEEAGCPAPGAAPHAAHDPEPSSLSSVHDPHTHIVAGGERAGEERTSRGRELGAVCVQESPAGSVVTAGGGSLLCRDEVPQAQTRFA